MDEYEYKPKEPTTKRLKRLVEKWKRDVLVNGTKGSTVHAVGCPCGFCRAGFTKA